MFKLVFLIPMYLLLSLEIFLKIVILENVLKKLQKGKLVKFEFFIYNEVPGPHLNSKQKCPISSSNRPHTSSISTLFKLKRYKVASI